MTQEFFRSWQGVSHRLASDSAALFLSVSDGSRVRAADRFDFVILDKAFQNLLRFDQIFANFNYNHLFSDQLQTLVHLSSLIVKLAEILSCKIFILVAAGVIVNGVLPAVEWKSVEL